LKGLVAPAFFASNGGTMVTTKGHAVLTDEVP
jgi:hypothetical protein